MSRCIQCNKEYEAIRATSKYCSDRCRVYYNRGVSVTDKLTVTPVSVTKEATVTTPVTVKEELKDRPIRNMEFCKKHIGSRKYTCGCK